MGLPKFILLKSNKNNNYLRYRKEQDSSHAFLQFTQDEKEENAEIPYIKFEVQKSETVEGFVHIRSCYNNKYWVRKSVDTKWVAAEANEPEEDQSKWSCTLFKAVVIDSQHDEDVSVDGVNLNDHIPPTTKPTKIRLVHVDNLGQHTCLHADTNLVMGEVEDKTSRTPSSDDQDLDVFIAYDAAPLVVLPEYVAFMDQSNKYGAPTTVSRVTYLEFKTEDIGHAGVTHVIQQNAQHQPPYLMVRNSDAGFLRGRLNSNFIVLDTAVGNYIEYLTPIRLGGNRIALRRLDDPRFFCNSIDPPNRTMEQVLGNSATSINNSAIFQVVEPVHKREVSNVVYNLEDSRVYNQTQVDKFVDERRNFSSIEQTGVFRVSYTTTRTKTWSDSISVSRSTTTSMSVEIPYVGEFGIELSEERTQSAEWGTEITEEQTIEYEQTVVIPPGKMIRLLIVATRGECDVPYTCGVRDTMTNGTVRAYTKTDGLFTGANEFNILTNILDSDL